MIYKCEHCKNRHDCHENKEQYENICKVICDIAKALDKLPEYHCFYNLILHCDYWIDDIPTYPLTMKSEVQG